MKIYEYIIRLKDQSSDKLNRLASSFNGANTKADRLSGATDRLGNRLKNVNAPVSKANSAFNQLNAQWSNSFNLGTMLTRVLGPTVLIAALSMGAMKASALAREYEQTNIAFEVMLGSADKAKGMLGEITSLANVTPFTRNELLDSAKLMLNFGIANEKILPNLKMLGDISGGNAQKMHMMTLAFSQSAAAGRLMGQDLLQMINAGFNPLQEISKKTGLSMAVLKKKMEDGAISTKMVEAAFKSATSEGGLFFGMMDRQSQTFAGRLSTLQDKMELWGTSIGKSLNDAFSPLLDKIISGMDRLQDKAGSVKTESDAEITRIRKLVTETLPLINRFDELQKKGSLGRTVKETQEYVETFRKLSGEIPLANVFDKATGKKVGFDSSRGLSFIENQRDAFIKESENKENALFEQLNKVNRRIDTKQSLLDVHSVFNKKAQANDKLKELEELAGLQTEKNRILQLIDEVKSSRNNAFQKLNPGPGGDKSNPFAELNDPTGKAKKLKDGINGITGGGKQSVNVTINLQSLIAEQNITTTSVREGAPEMERLVTEALLRVVNSANYAATQ